MWRQPKAVLAVAVIFGVLVLLAGRGHLDHVDAEPGHSEGEAAVLTAADA